jgi:hypothetical protein
VPNYSIFSAGALAVRFAAESSEANWRITDLIGAAFDTGGGSNDRKKGLIQIKFL